LELAVDDASKDLARHSLARQPPFLEASHRWRRQYTFGASRFALWRRPRSLGEENPGRAARSAGPSRSRARALAARTDMDASRPPARRETRPKRMTPTQGVLAAGRCLGGAFGVF